MGDILETQAHQSKFTKLCHLADDINLLQKQIDEKKTVPVAGPSSELSHPTLPLDTNPQEEIEKKTAELKQIIQSFEQLGPEDNMLLRSIIPGVSSGDDIKSILDESDLVDEEKNVGKLDALYKIADKIILLKKQAEAKLSSQLSQQSTSTEASVTQPQSSLPSGTIRPPQR